MPIVVVSANDDPAVIRRCMEFGASGFIPKTLGVDAMRAAIARVLRGGVWTPPDVDLTRQSDAETAATIARLATLTPQQVRVLMMLSGGLLNKQIAYELGVSEATVKAHVSAILQKLGVESRTQAVIAAGQDRSRPMAASARRGRIDLYSAATRCTRHCVISARNDGRLDRLVQQMNAFGARLLAHMRASGRR